MTRKNILIRGVDDSVYRRAKAAAASKGITLGTAVGEALAGWAKEAEDVELEARVDADLEFIRSNWDKIRSKNRGKTVVVSDGRLRGVFPTYEQARAAASKSKVALVFTVDKKPVVEREVELGLDLEV